jgi:hypothetical protein
MWNYTTKQAESDSICNHMQAMPALIRTRISIPATSTQAIWD